MPEVLNWQIILRPTPNGYSLKETSEDALSAVICSEVAQVVTDALADYLNPE
jgi:hypothetical protein